jgi:hypothetical protein
MPGRTLPPKLKTSSRHLAGNKLIIPPYSPDLVPSDFLCVPASEKVPWWPAFPQRWRCQEAVNTWFSSQAASFYDAGIQKLVPHYDKCLNNGGNYVEK